ncbi:MAG: hypothetical protein AAAC48_27870 [Phyllobacterium sp.]|uniref:hypothetical protein n=1 Tax=Phyllobacterium sp. TaxID=1871046 RepID=UPI0030EFE80B
MNKEGDNHQSDDHGIDFENIAASNGTPTSANIRRWINDPSWRRFDVRSTMAVSKSGSQPDRQNKIHQDENRRNACLIRGCDDWQPELLRRSACPLGRIEFPASVVRPLTLQKLKCILDRCNRQRLASLVCVHVHGTKFWALPQRNQRPGAPVHL